MKKNRLKKIISTAAAICLSLTMQCSAFTDINNYKMEEAVNDLYAWGIVKGYDDASFRPDNTVTRAEFTAMFNRALGIDDTLFLNGTFIFTDIEPGHWAYGDIAFGVAAGYIKGYGDETFRPENAVSYSEIAKMLVCAVGYSSEAERDGGYPNGYIKAANKLGIFKNVHQMDESGATRGNAALMLHEAMQVKIIDPVYGKESEYKKTDETLKDRLLARDNLNSIEGVVSKTHDTGLKEYGIDEKNRIMVDGVLFDSGVVNADCYLGMNVKVYFYGRSITDMPVIVSIVPQNNTVTEIEACNIDNAEFINGAGANSRAGYIKTEDGKKVSLSSELSVIYNGKALQNFTVEDLKIINGKIKLIENSRDSLYDVAFIEEYFSVIVDKVSAATETIFLKSGTVGNQKTIKLDSDNDDFWFSIHDENGESVLIEDLKEDNVITVKADKLLTMIDITAFEEKINGTVTQYDEENSKVVIDDKEYGISMDESHCLMLIPKISKTGTYYIDCYNNIVRFDEGELLLEELGLIEKTAKGNRLGGGFSVRLIKGGIISELIDKSTDKPYAETGNSDIVIYETESKIKYNGKPTDAERVMDSVSPGDLVKYRISSDGKLRTMDVLDSDVALDDANYNPDIKSFGGEFYIDKDTAIFCMPTNAAEDEDFFVNMTLNSGIEFNISAFDVDDDTQVAKAVIIKDEMIADQPGRITNNTDVTLVKKILRSITDGDEAIIIEGFTDGEEVSEIIKDEARVYTLASELQFGDVIYLSKNSQGFVDNIEYVEGFRSLPAYYNKDRRQEAERIFGKLHTVIRNRLDKTRNVQRSSFTINLAAGEAENQELVTTNVDTKVMPYIYMIERAKKKISVVTIDDMISSEEVGYDGATELFICKKKYNVKGIVIVK